MVLSMFTPNKSELKDLDNIILKNPGKTAFRPSGAVVLSCRDLDFHYMGNEERVEIVGLTISLKEEFQFQYG